MLATAPAALFLTTTFLDVEQHIGPHVHHWVPMPAGGDSTPDHLGDIFAATHGIQVLVTRPGRSHFVVSCFHPALASMGIAGLPYPIPHRASLCTVACGGIPENHYEQAAARSFRALSCDVPESRGSRHRRSPRLLPMVETRGTARPRADESQPEVLAAVCRHPAVVFGADVAVNRGRGSSSPRHSSTTAAASHNAGRGSLRSQWPRTSPKPSP